MRRHFLLANHKGSRRRQFLALREIASQIQHCPISEEVYSRMYAIEGVSETTLYYIAQPTCLRYIQRIANIKGGS